MVTGDGGGYSSCEYWCLSELIQSLREGLFKFSDYSANSLNLNCTDSIHSIPGHSKAIHDLRCAKIPARLRLPKFKKAMWANQRATARAAARTAALAQSAAQGGS
jgi:hypothetical protein